MLAVKELCEYYGRSIKGVAWACGESHVSLGVPQDYIDTLYLQNYDTASTHYTYERSARLPHSQINLSFTVRMSVLVEL